jgi:uncharacterized protein (PEP-CTERM system associated)
MGLSAIRKRSNDSHSRILRRRVAARPLAIALALCLLPAAGHAQSEFEFSVLVSESWVDNIDLAPDNVPAEEEWVTQVVPAINWDYESRRAQVSLDYRLQALFYAEDSDRDEVLQQAVLTTWAELVADWFFVDLAGSIDDVPVAPTAPVNVDNLFDTDLLAEARAVQVTPYLEHAFGPVTALASYNYGMVDYGPVRSGDFVLDDATQYDARGELRSSDEDGVFTWLASYNATKTDYEIAPTYRYDTAGLELGYLIVTNFRLLAGGGYESDLTEDQEGGGMDEPYYEAGFEWDVGPRTRVEGRVGERFYGTSYAFRWQRTGRVVNWDISYSDIPTNSAQERLSRPVEIEEMAVEPVATLEGRRLNSDVYIVKRFEANIIANFNRTTFELGAFHSRVRYLNVPGEDESYGGAFQVDRRMTPRMTLGGRAEWQTFTPREGGDPFDEVIFGLVLVQQLTPTLELNLRGEHNHRTEADGYTATWFTLGLLKRF